MNFKVTVSPKSSQHPFFKSGYNLCYSINNDPSATLYLVRGSTYTFDIESIGYPFYFTTSEQGGPGFPGSVLNNTKNIYSRPTDYGKLIFTITSNLPEVFYYGCGVYSYMGGKVIITDTDTDTNQMADSTLKLSTQTLYEGLNCPTVLTYVPGDPNTIYVCEQKGIVYKISKLTNDISTFLDLSSKIIPLSDSYDERGLLGLAFPNDCLTTKRFFVFYSSSARSEHCLYTNFLSEFQYTDSLPVQLESEVVLLQIPQTTTSHNGGRIEFGPDGYLYIGVGDGGPQKDPHGNAQNLTSPHGKILRLDVSVPGTFKCTTGLCMNSICGYSIPTDNPFVGQNTCLNEIYAYGFRNPWGLSFDNSNNLFVTDVGYNRWEEVNIVTKGGNYGWNLKEGTEFTQFTGNVHECTKLVNDTLIDPIFQYTFKPETTAIIGGYPINNMYIFGDVTGVIFAISPTYNQTWSIIFQGKIKDTIRSFGKDHDGHIYILTTKTMALSGSTGKILKLII